jgi:ABC-2 type transport system ATP-binding protein
MTTVLRAEGLRKTFKEKTAVDGVSFSIEAGEKVALLGPNGAGKTTTLFMLLGVVSPEAGSIEVVGHPLPKERSEAMAKVGFAAGYMPLTERLRVVEFLRMYAQLYGITNADASIMESLERFRIAHLAQSMGEQLSSGQRTLVGIVKATLHEPRLLVLDEPTASLDPDVALRVRTGLQSYCAEQGAALLVTSHNMREVERLCERVIFLAQGKVVADGSPAEVAANFSQGDLEEVFLHLAERREEAHTEERAQEGARP